jgi:hypothetical protein
VCFSEARLSEFAFKKKNQRKFSGFRRKKSCFEEVVSGKQIVEEAKNCWGFNHQKEKKEGERKAFPTRKMTNFPAALNISKYRSFVM